MSALHSSLIFPTAAAGTLLKKPTAHTNFRYLALFAEYLKDHLHLHNPVGPPCTALLGYNVVMVAMFPCMKSQLYFKLSAQLWILLTFKVGPAAAAGPDQVKWPSRI